MRSRLEDTYANLWQQGEEEGMKHETRNTVAILKWCNTCGKMTMHGVSDRRVGLCQEHNSRAKEKPVKVEKVKVIEEDFFK
jgi:PHP family Zn ribbon phosphoesterase